MSAMLPRAGEEYASRLCSGHHCGAAVEDVRQAAAHKACVPTVALHRPVPTGCVGAAAGVLRREGMLSDEACTLMHFTDGGQKGQWLK
eukprot:364208-Chlamydomonas_euryale.AAC.15